VATSKEPRDRSHRHTRVPEVRVDLLPESETGNMIDSGLGGKSAEYFDALVRLFSDAPRRRFDRLSLRWISGQRRSAGTSVRIRTLTEAGHGPNGKAAGTQRQPSRSARLVWPPPAPIRAHNSTISAARWDSASHVRRRLTTADDGARRRAPRPSRFAATRFRNGFHSIRPDSRSTSSRRWGASANERFRA
jgi:hypothetical protein